MTSPGRHVVLPSQQPPQQQPTQVKQVGGYLYRPDVDRIGRGSFATVYRAKRLKDGERVAIKRINITRLKRRLKENLELEISIMKRMHHPNIVKLFDTLESAEHMYLVMEFCDNGDLSKFIAKNKPLGESLVKTFAQQITSALLHLGRHNIIHRDIKPQNVLLQRGENGDMICKVADFGFARYLESEMAATLCGSPLYMAPEILDSQPYARKADLWSVGAVLYECLAGRAPFKASNYIELSNVIKKTCNSLPMPPGISADLTDLLRRVLKRDPDERISVDDFFGHPWLDLEAYQSTIVIGPDDDADDSRTSSSFRAASSPINMAVRPDVLSPSPTGRSLQGPTPSPQEHEIDNVMSSRRSSITALGTTPPSLHLPSALSTSPYNYQMGGVAPLSVSPPMPPFAMPSSPRSISYRGSSPSPPSISNMLSPTHSYMQSSGANNLAKRQTQPTVNPFKPGTPQRVSSANSLSTMGMVGDSGNIFRSDTTTEPGDSYVIVDKDYVEVNAFADALDLNKRAPSSTAMAPRLATPRSHPVLSSSAPSNSPMISLANAFNAATTYTTQRLFNVQPSSYPPTDIGQGQPRSFHEDAVVMEIEDFIRQAQSIMWLASKYDDGRSTMRSAFMSTSTSSTYSAQSTPASQVQSCALTLYVRALKQYRRGMDVVKTAIPSSASISPALNLAVQRLRDKYNECLEIAETLKSRILTASSHAEFRGAPRPNADKLMFDSAMRLCREADACELLADLAQADRQYKYAYNLLIALLANDADANDKAVLQQYVRNVQRRLEAIRQKRAGSANA